jgi:demethylmenaquinone methyltransferase/2-methoxy-6-polyprenyl-1,4-benzoquinol methylase
VALYDLVAPFYDPLLQPIYRPFRKRALDALPAMKAATVLDLACGTGQNFPLLAQKIGPNGKIIGLDKSGGMLRQARRAVQQAARDNVTLVKMDVYDLSHTTLKANTGLTYVDFIVCTYGFSAMRDWQLAFHRAFSVLKPGGGFLIHDIYAEKRTFHSWFVEKTTRSIFSRPVWNILQQRCNDFHMEYLDPSKHLFGGRLFVAYGTKH